jgi:hypothetical protein
MVAAAAGCAAAVKLTEDPPPLKAPKAGAVRGTIAPAEKVSKLYAVSRATGRRFLPDSWDKRTGKFRFAKLPGGANYDVCVETADGRRVEGIDLSFVDARMLRLMAARREQLELPPEAPHDFSPDDVKALLMFVGDLKDFMEIRRPLYIRGHGRRATVLLELMRTRDFYASKGEVIWRVELWYFENQYGGWEKLANQEVVLRRERIAPRQWRRIDVAYYPELSAHVAADGTSEPVKFTLPEKTDASRGRPAGTAPELETAPHVSGLDVKPPAPTTRPAAEKAGSPQPEAGD